MPLTSGRAYGVYAGNTPIERGDFVLSSGAQSIVAFAGGGKASATQIEWQITRVNTVATAGDSVLLPPSTRGLWVTLINHGAAAMQVYGAGTDTINDVATATGLSQGVNSAVEYFCPAPGVWYTQGLGMGFASNLPTVSYATVAANSAGTQAAGTAITAQLSTITAAGANYGITLPVSVPGMMLTIANISSQTIKVFPNAAGTTTETINVLSANAAISQLTATSTTFCCTVAGQWWTAPRVPS